MTRWMTRLIYLFKWKLSQNAFDPSMPTSSVNTQTFIDDMGEAID